MALQQLIYHSTATRIWGAEELDRLVAQARIYNFSCAITGVLFRADQHFLQVVEGEADVVESLYRRIAHDPRHAGFRLLVNEPMKQRVFPRWSLGFRQVLPVTLVRLERYLDPQHRAALLPRGYDGQEIIADLLREFMEEPVPTRPARPGNSWRSEAEPGLWAGC